MAGLTNPVTKSNHTGWSDHNKFLSGQAMAGGHLPGLSKSQSLP